MRRKRFLIGTWPSVYQTDEPLPDEQLVACARAGESAAFAALYERHHGAVLGAVRALLPASADPQDAVQEAFARALESIRYLRDARLFRQWVLGIARHIVRDQHRLPRPLLVDPAPEPVSNEDGPADLAIAADLVRHVERALGTLERRDAVAVTLATRYGFTPADVARALGVTTASAKVIVHRARRRLRTAMSIQALSRRGACDGLRAALVAGDAAARRHFGSCGTCAAITTSEIDLFDACNPGHRIATCTPDGSARVGSATDGRRSGMSEQTTVDTEVIVLSNSDGDYFALPRDLIEEFRVPADDKASVDEHLQGSEVSGFAINWGYSGGYRYQAPSFNWGSMFRGGSVLPSGAGNMVAAGGGNFRNRYW